MALDLTTYVKYPRDSTMEEQKPYVSYLLSNRGRFIGKQFLIGSNQFTLYGQPIPMMRQSHLIRSMTAYIFQDDPIPLLTHVELTANNLPGFLFVWFFLNEIFNTVYEDDELREVYSLTDLLYMWEFFTYFDVITGAQHNTDYNQLDMVNYAITQWKFTPSEIPLRDPEVIPLLHRYYDFHLSRCLADPFENLHHCSLAHTVVGWIPEPNRADELELVYNIHDTTGFAGFDGPTDFISYIIRKSGQEEGKGITELERKYANFAYDHELKKFLQSPRTVPPQWFAQLTHILGRNDDYTAVLATRNRS